MTMTTADWQDHQDYDPPEEPVTDEGAGMDPCRGCGSYQPRDFLDVEGECNRCADDAGRVHVPLTAWGVAP